MSVWTCERTRETAIILRFGVLLVLVLSLSACSSLPTEKPPVPDSTMVEVLTDLQLAEARAELYVGLPAGLRDSLLARHDLTPGDYETALRYYADHPDAYTSVYETVLDRLSAEQKPLHAPVSKDSLAK